MSFFAKNTWLFLWPSSTPNFPLKPIQSPKYAPNSMLHFFEFHMIHMIPIVYPFESSARSAACRFAPFQSCPAVNGMNHLQLSYVIVATPEKIIHFPLFPWKSSEKSTIQLWKPPMTSFPPSLGQEPGHRSFRTRRERGSCWSCWSCWSWHCFRGKCAALCSASGEAKCIWWFHGCLMGVTVMGCNDNGLMEFNGI